MIDRWINYLKKKKRGPSDKWKKKKKTDVTLCQTSTDKSNPERWKMNQRLWTNLPKASAANFHLQPDRRRKLCDISIACWDEPKRRIWRRTKSNDAENVRKGHDYATSAGEERQTQQSESMETLKAGLWKLNIPTAVSQDRAAARADATCGGNPNREAKLIKNKWLQLDPSKVARVIYAAQYKTIMHNSW